MSEWRRAMKTARKEQLTVMPCALAFPACYEKGGGIIMTFLASEARNLGWVDEESGCHCAHLQRVTNVPRSMVLGKKSAAAARPQRERELRPCRAYAWREDECAW